MFAQPHGVVLCRSRARHLLFSPPPDGRISHLFGAANKVAAMCAQSPRGRYLFKSCRDWHAEGGTLEMSEYN